MNNASADFSFIIRKQLKQITPYLHFHHDIQTNPGAVLRATEVKPKLDKYLIETMSAEYAKAKVVSLSDAKLSVLKKLKDSNLLMTTSSDKNEKRPPALRYQIKFFAHGEIEITNDTEMEIAAAELLYHQQSLGKLSEARKKIKNDYRPGDEVPGYGPLPRARKPHAFYFANMASTAKIDISDTHTHITEEEKDEYIALVQKTFKEAVFYKEPIDLQILCMNVELRKFIEKNLMTFFLLHNFGCRQSKGFGSFLPVFSRPLRAEYFAQEIKKTGIPYFMFKTDTSSANDRLNQALTVYSIMKAGLNHTGCKKDQTGQYFYANPNAYIKGFAVRNWLPSDTGSEKARIKSKILRTTRQPYFKNNDNHEPNQEYEKYVFIRALLGLADHYEFRDSARGRNGNVSLIHYPSLRVEQGKVTVDPKDLSCPAQEDKSIKRFQSPVTIKIFDSCVFFLFNDSWKPLLGQKFLFLRERESKELEKKLENEKLDDALTIIHQCSVNNLISIPESFDMKQFIRKFIEYFSAEKSKLSNFRPEYSNSQHLVLEGGNIDA